MRCAWSSSGGKDSLLALWHARQSGQVVDLMITMFDETGMRSRSHGISPELMRAQADALQMELSTPHASWDSYEVEFIGALKRARATGREAVVFGDIDLQAHRDWEEKVCAQAGLTPLLPLWQRERADLAAEVWRLGFKSVVVCVDHRYLGAEFCGREYDEAFVKSLPHGVDACGENGEFHTFVYDGPLFSERVPVKVEGVTAYEAPKEFGGARFSFASLV